MTRRPCRSGLWAAQWLVLSATLAACAWIAAVLSDSRTAAGFEWVNHDIANILYVGRAMLRGQRLYVDLVEINPPAIFLVSEFVALCSQTVRVSPVHLYHALVLTLALFGTWMIRSVYVKANRPAALVLVSLSFQLVLLGAGLPGDRSFTYSFGQREQVFALSFIPYLLWRWEGGRHDSAAYVMLFLVGFFSSLKPHFMVFVLAVESMRALDGRPGWRRVWPALAGGALLPLMLLVVHAPESIAGLGRETIRHHLGGVYAHFNQPYSTYLESSPHHWLLAHGAALVYFLWPVWLGAMLPRRTLVCAASLPLLGYGLVVQQHKFWEYHSILLLSLVTVLTFYVLCALLARLPARRRAALFGLAFATLALELGLAALAFREMIADWKHGVGRSADVLRLAPLLAGRPHVLYYSTSIVHMQLALFLDQRIVGKTCHDLVYPSIVRHPEPTQRSQLLEAYCVEQRELIRTRNPDAIVLHATGQGLDSRHQDVIDVLLGICRIVPERAYSSVTPPKNLPAAVFLRK